MNMMIKGRRTHMRHASRTRPADLECLFEKGDLDLNISVKYVHTNQQIADISTKGSFHM